MKQKMIHILMKNSMMVKEASFDLSNYSSTRQAHIICKDLEIEDNDVFVHLVIQMKGSEILNITSSRLHIVCIDPDGRIRVTPKMDMRKYFKEENEKKNT